MFVRQKPSGAYRYLQIVENRREGKRTVQHVITTLGRLDRLVAEGQVDNLVRSLARFSEKLELVEKHRAGELDASVARRFGPDLVFGRLWQEKNLDRIISGLLENRRFSFSVERAVYLSVLHRIFVSGPDRRALRWQRDMSVVGTRGLELQHLYRAMRWLGEVKDQVEENLFHRQADLFTNTTLAFFDTTTLYFEGGGGESIGQRGNTKDHRPDLKQMVVGAVLDDEGRPICCELWPGNTADSKALLPVVDRLGKRFGLRRICWVADRGMISAGTIAELESRGLEYILGARMRRQKEVREAVLGSESGFEPVADNLQVKEVLVDGRRYIACHNPEQAAKDAADREAIVASLEKKLRLGAKSLVGNKGYRRYLRVQRETATLDREKIAAETRFDGKYVLRTNTTLPAAEAAVQYKRLLMVEQFFRASKSLLETRPIYHKWDATIKGHVFCSFLALVLIDELKRRLADRGWTPEWADVCQDLMALEEVDVSDRKGDRYCLRTDLQGVAGKVIQAAGVAVPPKVRSVA